MSRSRTRARKRRALAQKLVAEFHEARSDPEAFSTLLAKLAASNTPIWPIARAAGVYDRVDDEGEERAMIAQVVAPHLAGMTPGSVHGRYAR